MIQLDPAEFQELFRTVRHSSWRWEAQTDYAVDHGELRAWLDGRPYPPTDEDRVWLDYIRGLRAAGIPFQRVRVFTEPLNDYLRWLDSVTPVNIEAGEDIRWISQHRAREANMPDYDFYIFDNNRVVTLQFDEHRELVGAELRDDEQALLEHNRYRMIVWPFATPHGEWNRPRR